MLTFYILSKKKSRLSTAKISKFKEGSIQTYPPISQDTQETTLRGYNLHVSEFVSSISPAISPIICTVLGDK